MEKAGTLYISIAKTKRNCLVAGLGHFLYSRHAGHKEAYLIRLLGATTPSISIPYYHQNIQPKRTAKTENDHHII
jgi:hypothetical protein